MALTKILEEGIKDGEIVNADINASAAIAKTKLASLDIVNADINSSAAIATSKITGLATSATTDTTNASNIGSGSLANARLTKPIDFADTEKARFGTGNDFEIQHDGTNNIFKTTTAAEIQLNYNAENMARFLPNGSCDLYYDNSRKFHTVSTGANITGRLAVSDYVSIENAADLFLTDNGKAVFGNGSDLQIYHDGSHSYIRDSGTGHLFIDSSKLCINNAVSSEHMATFTQDGAVELYHNGSQRFYTSTTGAVVTAGDTTLSIVGTNTNGYAQLKLQTTAGNNNNYIQSDHGLILWIDNANRYQFEPDGTFIVKDGNVKIATAGHGIDFSATSDASGNTSELLDDYEEGTFTPTLKSNTTTTGQQSGIGKYTKIGNMVHCIVDFESKNFSGISNGGVVEIIGMPFTSTSYTATATSTVPMTYDVYTRTNSAFYIGTSSTSLFGIYPNSGGAWSNIPTDDINQTQVYINFNITYFVN